MQGLKNLCLRKIYPVYRKIELSRYLSAELLQNLGLALGKDANRGRRREFKMAGLFQLTLLLSATAVAQVEESCRCGWRNQGTYTLDGETGVNEYPMMVGIAEAGDRRIFCGGTIISDSHVITAAHCLNDREPGSVVVIVGEHNVTTEAETNATAVYNVKGVVTHPDYLRTTPATNNIALIEVNGSIDFSENVGPACLPFRQASSEFMGNYVELLGWGVSKSRGSQSAALRKLRVSVVHPFGCQRNFRETTTNELCVYKENRSVCQMDGGPILWVQYDSKKLFLIGVVKRDDDCGDSIYCRLHTRIGAYLNWIRSVTPGVKYCRHD